MKPKDEDALAMALARLLENKPLREQMGARGRLKVVDYNWENVAREVMDYYEKVLSSLADKRVQLSSAPGRGNL